MLKIPPSYALNRILTFLLTVWLAATLVWILPRLSPVDPAEAMVGRMAAVGFVENAEEIIFNLQERFGLNDPLWQQYLKYLWNTLRFDFGISITEFPTPVRDLIATALPWTLGLMIFSIIITFVVGNLFGALMVWDKTPFLFRLAIPVSMIFTSIPPILSGLLLLYLFAVIWPVAPMTGAYGLFVEPGWTLEFALSVVKHGTLPALSIVIVSFGFWTLGMRGLMITVQGEDYTTLAKAKGLRPSYILYRYMVRNAILPQVTAFALKVGLLVSGQILVERVFSYNGMGKLIFDAIRDQNFPVIQGASFIIIVMTALSVLLVDLLYPLIDPRIQHQEAV